SCCSTPVRHWTNVAPCLLASTLAWQRYHAAQRSSPSRSLYCWQPGLFLSIDKVAGVQRAAALCRGLGCPQFLVYWGGWAGGKNLYNYSSCFLQYWAYSSPPCCSTTRRALALRSILAITR